jgi:hypothetical protein
MRDRADAVFVAPLTASVMSSVSDRDEGLASGVNNTASRIAQLIGVALAAGLAAMPLGYVMGMGAACVASLLGAAAVGAICYRRAMLGDHLRHNGCWCCLSRLATTVFMGRGDDDG